MAIKAMGKAEKLESSHKIKAHLTEQKKIQQQLLSDITSFQAKLNPVAKGQWTDAAMKCIDDTTAHLAD